MEVPDMDKVAKRDEELNLCIFVVITQCNCNRLKAVEKKELSPVQLAKIKDSSCKQWDGFFETICNTSMIRYHQNCYATYTSNEKIKRFLRKKKLPSKTSDIVSPSAKRLRSSFSSFDFRSACFFCGDECHVTNPDTKHPDKRKNNPSILCKTAGRGKSAGGTQRLRFKEVLLQVATILGDTVRIRLEGATSDLHAVDARYHKNCYRDFVNERLIKAANNQYDQEVSTDNEPLNYILRSIRNEPDRIWTTAELMEEYASKGGSESHVSRFSDKIEHFLKDEVYLFRSPGLSTIVMHKTKATATLKIAKTEEDPLIEMRNIAAQIKSELAGVSVVKNDYHVLDSEEISKTCLPTLSKLLHMISTKFSSSEKGIALY